MHHVYFFRLESAVASMPPLLKNKTKLNPHWHELGKQEKYSSLVPPRGNFLTEAGAYPQLPTQPKFF